MDLKNIKYEEVFKISTTSLRITRSHPDITRDKIWKCQFCIVSITYAVYFYFLSYSVLYHDIQSKNYGEACKNCALLIVFVVIALKYIVLVVHQQFMKDIMRFAEDDYKDDCYSAEEADIVLEYVGKGINICRFWLVGGFGTGALFPVKAFVAMAYYYWKGQFRLVTMYELTYPEPIESVKNITGVFWVLFVFVFFLDLFAAIMYVGFDPTIPIFMLHVCGQLEILSRRIGKVFIEYDDQRSIEENLKRIIIKLQRLYEFVEGINNNFSIYYEFNLKGSMLLIPFLAFRIVEDIRERNIGIEFVFFMFGSIIHFFIPAYYSDLLMEKSEDFRQAIYSSGWEKYPDKRVRQTILFMLTRATVPMGIRTVFNTINLDTFAEMCRQSYTLFGIMNVAWNYD